MPKPRPTPRYFVVEFEEQPTQESVAAALEIAKTAHERDRTRGYAVVELIAVVSSEHKTIVNRIK